MTIKAIMIDSREPKNVQGLTFGDLSAVVATLDYGDAWITTEANELLCVERKTPNDLIASIGDNRLFSQCLGMREKTPFAYLVVTGQLYQTADDTVKAGYKDTGWKWSSVQGALLTVQEMGVQVIYCKEGKYAETLAQLAKRRRDKEKVLQPLAQARMMTDHENILSALPGIGPNRAIELAKEFPTLAWSISWLTQTGAMHKVAGIGDGTKNKVRQAIGLDDGYVLGVSKEKSV